MNKETKFIFSEDDLRKVICLVDKIIQDNYSSTEVVPSISKEMMRENIFEFLKDNHNNIEKLKINKLNNKLYKQTK